MTRYFINENLQGFLTLDANGEYEWFRSDGARISQSDKLSEALVLTEVKAQRLVKACGCEFLRVGEWLRQLKTCGGPNRTAALSAELVTVTEAMQLAPFSPQRRSHADLMREAIRCNEAAHWEGIAATYDRLVAEENEPCQTKSQ